MVEWVIDNILLERHDEEFGYPTISQAATEAGHDVYLTKYIPFSDVPEFNFTMLDPSKPLICYGSIQFINQIERTYRQNNVGTPGSYFKKDALKFSDYAWRWWGEMLSDDYIILPYGEIIYRFKTGEFRGKFFIRPDVVTKTFSGKVVDFDTDNENPVILKTYEHIDNSELCVLARPKEIIGEYRHVVCRGEVIAQSQYQRNSKLDIRIDVEPDCQKLAKLVAREEYQPDTVYVVDTALTPNGPKIIEFNAFSCSGLYACDTRAIVKHVSEAAQAEFDGDDL